MADKKFVYVFDTYVRIEADDEDEARDILSEVESIVDGTPQSTLVIFDAYGIEDNETGEEIREVG